MPSKKTTSRILQQGAIAAAYGQAKTAYMAAEDVAVSTWFDVMMDVHNGRFQTAYILAHLAGRAWNKMDAAVRPRPLGASARAAEAVVKAPAPAHKTEAPAARERQGPKVLVVDDESDMLRLAGWLLTDLWPTAEVHVAQEGNQGIRMLCDVRPDLLITDIHIPGPNGDALGRFVRESPFLRHTKVLVMTGFHNPQTHQEALLCGADEYLAKPFEPTEFLGCILRLVGRDSFPLRRDGGFPKETTH